MRFWSREYRREKARVRDYQIGEGNAMEVENISFSMEDQRIVDGFSFKFKRNRIYSLVGAVGSGKSSIAAHFNGLIKSPSGNVFLFNGEKICFYRKKIPNFKAIRRTVGMVLQNPEYQLFKESVLEDVCCGLEMLNVGDGGRDIRGIAMEKLRELGIGDEHFHKNPFMLSGGQKKKVALSGILVIDPEIVVFDEPILGLDPASMGKIADMIRDLKRKNKTIILISNNIDFILDLSEEILVIDRGRLIMNGPPYLVFRDRRLGLGTPKIISFIEKITSRSSRFDSLWLSQPRNSEELANCIFNVLNR